LSVVVACTSTHEMFAVMAPLKIFASRRVNGSLILDSVLSEESIYCVKVSVVKRQYLSPTLITRLGDEEIVLVA
jgi:hypothetical protein